MNRYQRVLLAALPASCSVFYVSANELSFAQKSSIPPSFIETFKHSWAAGRYVFDTPINPFFIQGDFNGDGRLDCAILVKEKSSGKLGIAIVHTGENQVRIMGAGRRFGNGGDDFAWVDAWYAYPKGAVRPGADGSPPPKLRGDALMVIKTEAASSLIYWTGKQYRWYQQED